MSRLCSKTGCEFEVDYTCECLSLQTYWCQFHLEEHLKLLPNRTHAFDSIIVKPSQEISVSILDFFEKEKSKIEKLKEIALASLSPNLYNSRSSIEETFKNFDYNLKEINLRIKKITKSLKKSKGFSIKELNNSELYNAKLCFILNQLKIKRSKILGSSSNEPSAEKDFRKTCYLYENSSSDPSLCQAYHEYVEAHDKFTSLYLIGKKDNERSNLYIYNTESECEEAKVLEIQDKFDWRATSIAQLPNGELFCCRTPENAFIIDRSYKLRRLPSCKTQDYTSAIYFNRSIYCFGGGSSIRFDLEKNRWIHLSRMLKNNFNCSSVIFNGNIIIAEYYSTSLMLYSIDIDSFSSILCNFRDRVTKILIKGDKRLYLIQSSWKIFESDVGDEYTWKLFSPSIANVSEIGQCYCSYNKGGIYISFFSEENSRQYFKFDLAQKVFIEMAFYNESAVVKRSRSKHEIIEYHGKTFKFDSDIATFYFNKGYSLSGLGRDLKKIECLNEAINLEPNNPNSYRTKGSELLKFGRKLEAIECYNQVLKLDPRNANAFTSKAKILCDLGREVEVIDFSNEAINKDPSFECAYTYKGYALCKLRRYAEAIECCNEAIRLDNSKAYQAYLSKADALSSLGRKDEAIESINNAINLNHWYYLAHEEKVKILSELGRDLEVIDYCNTVIKRNYYDMKFHTIKGKALSRLGRNIEKNECYEMLIINFNIENSEFREAFIECDLKTKNEAIELYNEEISSDPFHLETHIRKGYGLYNLNRKIEAIQCYNNLFKIDPQNKIKYIEDILDLPNYNKLFETGIEKAKVSTMNEEDLHFLDWIIELIERYSEEIEIKTHYSYAYVLKGCTLHLAGKYLEEIECYDKAIAINPDDQNICFAKDDTLKLVEKAVEAIENNN